MKITPTMTAAAKAVSTRPEKPATALVHDCADARVVLFRIDPGQEVPVHTSASTVLLTIVSGSGTVIGAEGEQQVTAGDLVAYEANEPHGMRAGSEQLVISAVIAPRPAAR